MYIRTNSMQIVDRIVAALNRNGYRASFATAIHQHLPANLVAEESRGIVRVYDTTQDSHAAALVCRISYNMVTDTITALAA